MFDVNAFTTSNLRKIYLFVVSQLRRVVCWVDVRGQGVFGESSWAG